MKLLKQNKLLILFLSFLKIGTFSFGGGHAMIPVIEEDLVKKHKFITEETMKYMIAISESTPGVVAINMATFTGYKIKGIWGSIVATLGVIFSPILIMMLFCLFMQEFLNKPLFSSILTGLKCGSLVLILRASLNIFKKSPKSALTFFIIFLTLPLVFFTSYSLIFYLLIWFTILFLRSFLVHSDSFNYAYKQKREKINTHDFKYLFFIGLIILIFIFILLVFNLKSGFKSVVLGFIFFLIGCITFGGGYAMIPFIEELICKKINFVSEINLFNYIAISESTPGPFAVNVATILGFNINSSSPIISALFSSVMVILPSFIIVFVISKYFNLVLMNPKLKFCLNYILPVVFCFVFVVFIKYGMKLVFLNNFNLNNLLLISFLLLFSFLRFRGRKINLIYVLIMSVFCGIFFL